MKKQMSKPKPNNHLLPAPKQTNKAKTQDQNLFFIKLIYLAREKLKMRKRVVHGNKTLIVAFQAHHLKTDCVICPLTSRFLEWKRPSGIRSDQLILLLPSYELGWDPRQSLPNPSPSQHGLPLIHRINPIISLIHVCNNHKNSQTQSFLISLNPVFFKSL